MSDKKFTDEEIIKTLECCADSKNYQCNKCPLYADCEKASIAENALDLINRQKSEIEELKNYIHRCKSGKEYWVKCLLEKPHEAINEFAEKLKKKCYEDFEESDEMLAPYVTEDNIDEVLKEMVGEEE